MCIIEYIAGNIKHKGNWEMTIKPGNYYEGKITGEFKLNRIAKVNGEPVFIIETVNNSHIELTLAEMKEEKVKAI